MHRGCRQIKDVDTKYLDSQVSATNSGSSTPQTSTEDTWSPPSTPLWQSSDDADEVNSSSGWVTMPTPESSPCRVVTTTTQPSTWTASMHPQVQALHAGTPQSSPVMTVSPPGLHGKPSFTTRDDGSVLFEFTHRRAQDVEWGLDVTRTIMAVAVDESLEALVVDGVLPGLAIDSWNRQIISTDGPMAIKVVQAGDLIVAVNDKHDCESMVRESSSSILLKMKVLRQKSGH